MCIASSCILNPNKHFSANVTDGTLYIGADSFETDQWAKDLVHEVTHLEEGTEEYNKLVQELSSEDILIDDGNGGKISLVKKATEKVLRKGYVNAQQLDEILKKANNNETLTAQERKVFNLFESELTAHESELYLGSEAFIDKIIESDTSLAKKIFDKIFNTKQALQKVDKNNAEAKKLLKAEKLWLNASKRIGNIQLAKYIQSKEKELEENSQEGVENKGETQYNLRKRKKKKYINNTVPQTELNYIEKNLKNIFKGLEGGIVNEIAIVKDNTIYVVDAGNTNGNVQFGVCKEINIDNINDLQEAEAEINDRAFSNDLISEEVFKKIRHTSDNDSGVDIKRELQKKFSTDNGESSYDQRGILEEDEHRGLGIELDDEFWQIYNDLKAAYEADKEYWDKSQFKLKQTDQNYLDAINRGDMETAQKMVDDAAKTQYNLKIEPQDISTITKESYIHHAWATNSLTGVLSPQEIGQFNSVIGQIQSKTYKPTKTKDGRYLIEVGEYVNGERTTLILTDGVFKGPSIDMVIKLYTDDKKTTKKIKEFLYARTKKTSNYRGLEESIISYATADEIGCFGIYTYESGTDFERFDEQRKNSSDIEFDANGMQRRKRDVDETGDTNFNLKQTDQNYLDAINRGDMETAQKMVDEAAKTQYNFNVDESSDLFTATDEFVKQVAPKDRKVFPRSLSNKTSSIQANEHQIVVINGVENIYYFEANGYMRGKVIFVENISNHNSFLDEVEGKRNEFITDARVANLWSFFDTVGEGGAKRNIDYLKDTRTTSENDSILKDTQEGNITGNFERDGENIENHVTQEEIDEINKISEEIKFIRDEDDRIYLDAINSGDMQTAKKMIELTAEGEGFTYDAKENRYKRFNQVKSADTITYDDNGKIIPLSKRFDSKNPDIRFNLKSNPQVSLSNGEIRKIVANYTRLKVYSRNETEISINNLIEELDELFATEKISLKGKSKEEAIQMLWQGLNIVNTEDRQAFAEKVAEYIIKNSIVESTYKDADYDYYADVYNILILARFCGTI